MISGAAACADLPQKRQLAFTEQRGGLRHAASNQVQGVKAEKREPQGGPKGKVEKTQEWAAPFSLHV